MSMQPAAALCKELINIAENLGKYQALFSRSVKLPCNFGSLAPVQNINNATSLNCKSFQLFFIHGAAFDCASQLPLNPLKNNLHINYTYVKKR